MQIQIEVQKQDGSTETEVTELGTTSFLYDFSEEGCDIVVATAAKLRYYGQLAVYRCPLRDTISDPFSIGTLFSRILSSPLAEATQDAYLKALLCSEGESYETDIRDPNDNLTIARFTLLSEEAFA